MKGVLDFRAFSQPVSTTGENIGNFDGMPMLGGPGIRALRLTPPSSLYDQQNHPTDGSAPKPLHLVTRHHQPRERPQRHSEDGEITSGNARKVSNHV